MNQSYLPPDTIDSYNKEPSGQKICALLPQGKSGEEIKRDITGWFRKFLSEVPNSLNKRGSSQMKTGRRYEIEDDSLPLRGGLQAFQKDGNQAGGYDPAPPPTQPGTAYLTARQGESSVSIPSAL